MNQSESFLAEIDSLANREIPKEVMERARQSLLDFIAVSAAGACFQREKLMRYAAFTEPAAGSFTEIGTGRSLVLKEAVFLNGLNGHALDFDDGTNAGIIHLGTPVFSLLLPLAEKYGKTVEELLRAAVIGYEVSFTVAVSIQPGHKARGYHATGTCGTLGATVAASYLLDFTKEERFAAFGAACVSASGMLKVLDDGSELKPYNAAKTALLALTALEMAKAGFKAHPDPLGGRGFFYMMTGNEQVEMKPVLLNGSYAIQKSYTKPYASCRYTHPPIEAAVTLRNLYGLRPVEIESVTVYTYALAVSGHDHTDIPNPYSAKMSTPYSTAAALMYGRAGLKEFTEETIRDEKLLRLTRKVKVVAEEQYSAVFPEKQTALLEIRARGMVYRKQVDFPKGEPENPLSETEFLERFEGLLSYAGKCYGENVYRLVYTEKCSVSELTAALK